MKRWEQAEMTKRTIERIQKMRREIQDVLNNEEKAAIQKGLVNDVFMAVAVHLEGVIEPQLSAYFNAVAQGADDKFTAITKLLTYDAPADAEVPGFSPVLALPLSINPTFLALGPEDLKAMPGYIQMHAVARKYDVALKIHGLTREENSGSPSGAQTVLFVDLTKGYAEGAEANPGFYPDLPEQKKTLAKPIDIRETIHPKKIARPPAGDFTI